MKMYYAQKTVLIAMLKQKVKNSELAFYIISQNKISFDLLALHSISVQTLLNLC